MKTELCILAEKYGTDKFIFHTPYYHELLNDRRDSIRNVLELGIGYPEVMEGSLGRLKNPPKYRIGASLFMWRDYFPNAEILGLDRNSNLLFCDDRISTAWFDQSDKSTYPMTRFDLIVDDGSHEMEHQLTAMNALVPWLSPGGIYIMEDIKPTSMPEIFSRIPYKFEHKHFENPDLPVGDRTADIAVIRNE